MKYQGCDCMHTNQPPLTFSPVILLPFQACSKLPCPFHLRLSPFQSHGQNLYCRVLRAMQHPCKTSCCLHLSPSVHIQVLPLFSSAPALAHLCCNAQPADNMRNPP